MISNGQIHVKREYQNTRERGERENEDKKQLKKIKAENFPNLIKDRNFQTQDILNTKRYHAKKSMNSGRVFKLLSQRANLESSKIKTTYYTGE